MEYEKKIMLKEKSRAELSVTVKQVNVEQGYKDLLVKYSKELQLPGFRKGHVPVKILETKYGSAVRDDLAGDVIEEVLKEVFENIDEYERPLPYSYPELKEKPVLNPKEDFVFTVEYDVFPKLDIKIPAEMKFNVTDIIVNDSDIDEEIKILQDRNALVTECKEDVQAQEKNIATIDFFEIDDAGNEIANSMRKDFVFTIGANENYLKIDDQIIGMKKGETKEISKTYAANDENSTLAGTTKKFKVTLKTLKYKDLPELDDEFVQDINEKYKTIDDLKADIKKNLQNNADAEVKNMKESSVIDILTNENTFDVPKSMIDADLESRWRLMAQKFGIDPEKMEKLSKSMGQSKNSLFESWKADSEKTLKGRIIIESLMKQKKYEVTDAEIEAEYSRLAELTSLSVEEIKKYYATPQQKEQLIANIEEDKLFDELYKNCVITKDKKKTLKEFLQK